VRTGIANLADALISAAVVLTAAIMCAGAAGADPSEQQDQFLALLEQDEVPAIDNVPALVARAHQICGELDGGASVEAVVKEEMDGMFDENPAYRQQFNRIKRTAVRFIAVSAEVYCPGHLADPYISDDVGFSIRDYATDPVRPDHDPALIVRPSNLSSVDVLRRILSEAERAP